MATLSAMPALVFRERILNTIMRDSIWTTGTETWNVVHLVDSGLTKSVGVQHLEVTEEHVRLEFESNSSLYLSFLDLFFAARDTVPSPLSASSDTATALPAWLVPVDVRNLMHVGSGGSVLLCRKRIKAAFRVPKTMTIA